MQDVLKKYLDDFLKKSILFPRSMLFEDQTLQMGVVSEFSGFAAQLRIFLKNKAPARVSEIELAPVFDQSAIKVGVLPFQKELEAEGQAQVVFQVQIGGFEFPTPLFQLTYQ